MTREQAKELLPIIKAFAEGKTIEFFNPNMDYGWQETKELNPDAMYNRFRIKPEPIYRPFKNAGECWNEMQNHQPFGWVKRFGNYTQIITLDNNTITLSNSIGKSSYLSYKDQGQIAFADGTPFGIKEEN